MKLIKQNTTLTNLHLTLMNYDNREYGDFVTFWPGH